jgi:hypothetical protein
MLQSKAGYIDARPQRQFDEIFLQRTAGPYIGVKRVVLIAYSHIRSTSNNGHQRPARLVGKVRLPNHLRGAPK